MCNASKETWASGKGIDREGERVSQCQGIKREERKREHERTQRRVDRERDGGGGAGEGGGEKGGGLLFSCITQRWLGLRRSNYLPVRLIVHPYASGDTRPSL